jgi:hypothetical protein
MADDSLLQMLLKRYVYPDVDRDRASPEEAYQARQEQEQALESARIRMEENAKGAQGAGGMADMYDAAAAARAAAAKQYTESEADQERMKAVDPMEIALEKEKKRRGLLQ